MLHRYRFKNFYSFRDWCDISLEQSAHVPDTDRVALADTGQRLTKLLAVMGANGSGKTNVIKPLVFLDRFMLGSFQSKPDAEIPFRPHFFSDDEVARFELWFDKRGELWRYELAVTRQRVVREALFRRGRSAFSYVFVRQWNAEAQGYDIKQKGFGFRPSEAIKVRQNASLLSTAAQYEVPLAQTLADLLAFSNLDQHGRTNLNKMTPDNSTGVYKLMPWLRERMSELLSRWDLGLARVELRPVRFRDEKGEEQELPMPFGIHSLGDREHALELGSESSGTQGAYTLLSSILPALEFGGIAVIDEMESDLHPHMLAPILDLFMSPETNPHKAQILFTCHAPEVLNLLHKSQVVLVQKDENCDSIAWRLDSVRGVRSDDNLYAKYMAGAYGAVPEI